MAFTARCQPLTSETRFFFHLRLKYPVNLPPMLNFFHIIPVPYRQPGQGRAPIAVVSVIFGRTTLLFRISPGIASGGC